MSDVAIKVENLSSHRGVGPVTLHNEVKFITPRGKRYRIGEGAEKEAENTLGNLRIWSVNGQCISHLTPTPLSAGQT